MFSFANDELKEIAMQLFNEHKSTLNLTVSPEKVVFMRSDKKKNAYAYCKRIGGEMSLLSDKKFIIVIVSENYNELTEQEKKYVILHELKHLDYNIDKDKYRIIKHDIQDFHELLVNPKWNIEIIGDKK